jgi:4-hydroxy-tetrahydrodipicolinate synthase
VRTALAGNFAAARDLHEHWYPLFRDLFVETNPVPIKTALALQGRVALEFRLPLCELSQESAQTLQATLASLHLIP